MGRLKVGYSMTGHDEHMERFFFLCIMGWQTRAFYCESFTSNLYKACQQVSCR